MSLCRRFFGFFFFTGQEFCEIRGFDVGVCCGFCICKGKLRCVEKVAECRAIMLGYVIYYFNYR